MPVLSDHALHEVLHAVGYTDIKRIAWAIEVLQGRINLATIRCEFHPVDRNVYSLSDGRKLSNGLTEDQITEAAQFAAFQQLRHDFRFGHNDMEGA